MENDINNNIKIEIIDINENNDKEKEKEKENSYINSRRTNFSNYNKNVITSNES